MKPSQLQYRGFYRSLTIMGFACALGASVQAQTAPAPVDTTYTNAGTGLWITPANWDNGVPTGTPSTATGSNAKIGDGQTALWQQNLNGDPAFGTLTLGVNSTLRYQANNNQGLPSESRVYFSNGSHLQYIAGSSNRNDNFFILPGATASFTTAGGTFFNGTLQGAGNLNVTVNGNFEMRKDTASTIPFTGNLTITNATATGRQIWLRTHGAGTQRLGQGVNTIGANLYLLPDGGNRIPDNATLRLVGGPGVSNQPKYRVSGDETIANLIIESPTQTVPYMITGNSTNSTAVRVTDTATFQGTAGTIEIQSQMGGEFQGLARVSGVDINANNMLFQGTGNWTINGSKTTGASAQPQNFAIGSIGIVGGGNVTTLANVTVNAAFDAPNGFTKLGAGTLTLNYTDPVRTVQGGTQNFNPKGTINVNEGTLVVNSTFGATVIVNSNGTLGGTGTINGATTIAGTHAPGASPGIQNFGSGLTYSGGATVVEWELAANATSVRGTDFDGINVIGDLNIAAPTSLELIFNDPDSVLDSVDWTDAFWATSKTGTAGWLIYDVGGTTTGFGNLAIAVENWADSNGALFVDELAGSSFGLFLDGDDIYLNFNAASVGDVIPEPSTLLLGCFGMLGLFLRRRRD